MDTNNNNNNQFPEFHSVQTAYQRIKDQITLTPVHTSQTLSRLAGVSLYFKCELFQKSGAFKFRGAINSILALSKEQLEKGVVTHSSGNHGGALALAGKLTGVKVTVVMPQNSPSIKRQAVLEYGAQVRESGNTQRDRERECEIVQKESGATLIPPYDYKDVIAGQGTISIEFLEQVPHLDAIIVPCGGGGMLSGIALAAKHIKPSIIIIGAEPKEADDAFRSFHSRQRVEKHTKKLQRERERERREAAGNPSQQPEEVYDDDETIVSPNTIADGLKTCLGELTFPLILQYVDEIFTVEEEEIYISMRWIWQRMKLMIEPSAAVGVAVTLFNKQWKTFQEAKQLKHVGVILCGGNVDFDAFVFPEYTKVATENSYQ